MRRTPIFLMATMLVVAACSSSKDDASTLATSTTTTSTSTSTTAPGATSSTSTATSAPRKICSASPPATPPAQATSGSIPDVDGDGSADTGFVDEHSTSERRIGVVTAAGSMSTVDVPSASPVPLSLFVADADHAGGPEILASDGRLAQLFTYVGCKLEPVLNRQGRTYSFDLGFGDNGTGVGCATIDGKPELVGLKAVSDDGHTVHWTRTVIELDGTHASNGPTDSGDFSRPDQDHAIDLLHTISCGGRTIDTDGIHGHP
jgi:hypothetical protein